MIILENVYFIWDDFERELKDVRDDISDNEDIDLGRETIAVAVSNKIYLNKELLTQKQPTILSGCHEEVHLLVYTLRVEDILLEGIAKTPIEFFCISTKQF